mmetsp:Transcript_42498/g.128964  ORF Transcript_42498/g.128964 Transcript_42498/m.128964 type:complete len:83 (-) Transcript_42498:14-262(-)
MAPTSRGAVSSMFTTAASLGVREKARAGVRDGRTAWKADAPLARRPPNTPRLSIIFHKSRQLCTSALTVVQQHAWTSGKLRI